MSGSRYLFISKDSEVIKIPTPKRNVYNPIPELHDQLVLEVILHYKTQERKPLEMLYVSFDRLQLDCDGRFILNDDESQERFRNFGLYAFQTPQSLSEKDDPLPIPSAIVQPTALEKEAIKKYIKNMLPQLYESGVYVIEKEIKHRKEIYDKYVDMVKEAARIRNKNDK